MTPMIFDVSQIEAEQHSHLAGVVAKFNVGVAEIRQLIEEHNVICHMPVSQGKDSTVVELMGIEAYRQAIAGGTIEKGRPLIVSTGNPGGDAIPMNFYVSYARTRLIRYAMEHGINLIYDIVKPPLNDEYFVRFAGGQKLIPNASRSGDCSVILKVDPSRRYLKSLLSALHHDYRDCPVVSLLGSREAESGRRSGNMEKFNLKRPLEELLADLDQFTIGGHGLSSYAPIKSWGTDEVFDALRIAGNRPLKRIQGASLPVIPAFLDDFGLLLEIYGNGSNETCEISVGSKASAGCNGKARFGCVFCTMVGQTDKSSTALSQLPRWDALGASNALRLRDYLYRLSANMDARAFHARAYDPAGFNRIALQPNILKPKFLEKIVRYAAQLTLESRQHAAEFAGLVAQGREMEHPGYRDIAEDVMMPPKTKKAFLEMYREGAQKPECLHSLFSEEHALLLSFRWAIDGIGAAPYRPLAIWKQLERGEGWIPYPKLNAELGGSISLSNDKLPEALMVPVYEREDFEAFAAEPRDLLSMWSRPADMSDLQDEDRNCTITRLGTHQATADIAFTESYSVVRGSMKGGIPFHAWTEKGACTVTLMLGKLCIDHVKVSGKALNGVAHSRLVGNIVDQLADRRAEALAAIESLMEGEFGCADDAEASLSAAARQYFGAQSLRQAVPYLRSLELSTGYLPLARAAEPAAQFTRRVTKVARDGTLARGNTRLQFYPVVRASRLHRAHAQSASALEPSFQTHAEKFVSVRNTAMILADAGTELDNISIDLDRLAAWKAVGGMTGALAEHDAFIKNIIKGRHLRATKPWGLRTFGGTKPAEDMMFQGVVVVEQKYVARLKAIVKRTQVFNDLALFDFQSCSQAQMMDMPGVITMDQHRKDKARLMTEVRRLRNAQRTEVRMALRGGYHGNVKQNLAWLTATASKAITTMIDQLAMSSLRIEFDTVEVPANIRANVSSLWMAMYFGETKSIDDVLATVLSPSQFKQLKAAPAEYLSAGQEVVKCTSVLAERIQFATSTWVPVVEAVRDLLAEINNGGAITTQDYKDLIHELLPPSSWRNEVIALWKPSTENLRLALSSALARLDENVAQLCALRDHLVAIERKQVAQITKNLTSAQKFGLLVSRAV